MTDEIDVDNPKKVIITTASLHYGISSNIVLNDDGDRINADYDIWSVTKSNLDADQYIWKHDMNWIEFDVTRADHVPKLYDMYNEAKLQDSYFTLTK